MKKMFVKNEHQTCFFKDPSPKLDTLTSPHPSSSSEARLATAAFIMPGRVSSAWPTKEK